MYGFWAASFVTVLLNITAIEEFRNWTDQSGKFSVQASLVRVDRQSMVTLQRPDGSQVKISFFKLCEADQTYLRQVADARKDAAGSPAPARRTVRKPVAGGAPISDAPPPQLQLPDFYQKHLDFQGIAIVAPAEVDDAALRQVRQTLELLLSKRPDVVRALVANRLRVAIIAPKQPVTAVPENSKLEPREYWNKRTRSIAASRDRPVMTVPEENVLGQADDPYAGESLVVHELAHTVHELALKEIDAQFEPQLKASYAAAMQKGLWSKTFAATNFKEYWAEGVQSWLNVNRTTSRQDGQPDGLHNQVDTRDKLRHYDPQLAKLISQVFP